MYLRLYSGRKQNADEHEEITEEHEEVDYDIALEGKKILTILKKLQKKNMKKLTMILLWKKENTDLLE